MDDWKIRQEIFHRLNREHLDDLRNFHYTIEDNIIDNAVRYFRDLDPGWIWPAKSYMVGICYSKWLAEIYGGKQLKFLSDPELLYNNDSFFKPYPEDSQTYDAILEQINGWNFDDNAGIVPDVRHFFDLEFGLKGS